MERAVGALLMAIALIGIAAVLALREIGGEGILVPQFPGGGGGGSDGNEEVTAIEEAALLNAGRSLRGRPSPAPTQTFSPPPTPSPSPTRSPQTTPRPTSTPIIDGYW